LAFAIISDIHGNLEGLKAVLDDITARRIRNIICLGDVIGYGPNPKECLDLTASVVDECLLGNHDQAVLYGPISFHLAAEKACFWTRKMLEEERDSAKRNHRWKFLGDRLIKLQYDNMLFVHASPRRPINEYIFPEDVFTARSKLESIFERFEGTCFVGHTHMAGVFTEGPEFLPPDQLRAGWRLGRQKAVINVGSVGQPRDRDWRSCYVIVDDTFAHFVRVEYDVDKTVAKIHEVPDLDHWLGNRLRDGR
jgi:diadenosine tetraphosphatase ApaH/serine/threonine PP2A family protein phosphatase